jgi:3-oxoacyl-[acyl-carrier protein] reductase
MIAPLMLIRPIAPTMKERKFGRIINITSTMVTCMSKNEPIE